MATVKIDAPVFSPLHRAHVILCCHLVAILGMACHFTKGLCLHGLGLGVISGCSDVSLYVSDLGEVMRGAAIWEAPLL